MKDKLIQLKQPTRVDSLTPNFKLTINDPTLKKYLEMTLSRFTTKCSFLVSQIDDIKREFIAQIEGLNEFFPNSSNSIPLPIVSPVRKHKAKRIDPPPLVNEITNSHSVFSDFHSNSNKIYLSTTSNVRKSERNEIEPYAKIVKTNPEPFFEKKLSITIKDTNEEDMQLKISFAEDDQQRSKKGHHGLNAKKNIPSKTKALICLSNSEYNSLSLLKINSLLLFEDKIKLKSLNQILHKETQTKEIISSAKKFLEDKTNGLISEKKSNFPSQTSQSSLNFIKKENENELKDMSNKFNRAFYELVYILSGEVIPLNISFEHLYESVLRKNQAQSIKHLFLSVYLKKLVECPLNYSNAIIEKFNTVIKNNLELISQNELLNENKSLSLFSFCLKEFYLFFQYEMERRDEIQRLKLLLNQLNDWVKTHHLS